MICCSGFQLVKCFRSSSANIVVITAKMFKLLLLLFAVQSVHLTPARHIYQGFNTPRYGRQTIGSNRFNLAAFNQAGRTRRIERRQDLISGSTAGTFGGSSASSLSQGQSQNTLQSGLPQNQNIAQGQVSGLNSAFGQNLGLNNGFGQAAEINGAFGQSAALNAFSGFGPSQNIGFGQGNLFGQSQNIGFGQGNLFGGNVDPGAQSQDDAYARIEAQLAQIQNANLNQGVLPGTTLNAGFGLNQGLAQGTTYNQDFLQNQAYNQATALNQGFNQNLLQNQGFNQGANQQLFNAAPTSPPQFGPDPATGGLNPQIFTPANQNQPSSLDDQQKAVEIGGKPLKTSQPFQQPDSITFPNNEDDGGPIVTKDFYLHAAPEDTEDEELDYQKLKLGPSRKHYNVVFIKSPSLSAKSAALKLLQANSEEKTVIYVLNKQLDPAEIKANIKQLPSHVSKPEVFFIKYRTPEEAQYAQQKIQAQFDALGGTSRISDEGISPITSVVGALNDQFAIGQQPINGQQQLFNGQQQQIGGQQQLQLNEQQQQQQQGGIFTNNKANQFLTNQQGFSDRGDHQYNSGEGIIEPRIGPGKPVELDGEAVGKVQNFGAAGQVDSSLLKRKLQAPVNKPRH